MKEVEYRVRPVTRYVVTRWYTEGNGDGACSASSGCLGEFDNETMAVRVMVGMAAHEGNPAPYLPLAEDGKSIKWTEA